MIQETMTRGQRARPDQFLEETFATVQATVKGYVDEAVEQTRQNPQRALLWAFVAGYLMRLLPTTRILSGLLRLGFAVVRPAAFVYGLSKLWNTQPSALSDRTR